MLDYKVTTKLFDYFTKAAEHHGYISDVISMTDANGFVSEWVTRKLFNDHGSSESEYIDAGNPANNALFILEWLGY
tara:strand:- start:330 stop:557 length:228 start_codon:yes stop_codon:yes gene_type:complete